MFYLIQTKDVFRIKNEKELYKFVNQRTSDAYDFINNTETAKQWLNENGYKIIRRVKNDNKRNKNKFNRKGNGRI